MPLLKQLYDVNSFKAFTDSSRLELTDSAASGGMLLAQQLKFISPTILEKKFPSLVLMNAGLSVNNEGGYSKTITSLRSTPQGSFTQVGNKASNSGKISLGIENSSISVFSYAADSEWSDDEVKASEIAGINLPNRFISAHNEIYMRAIDSMGLVGVETLEGAGPATGLLNYAGFTTSAATGAHTALTPAQNFSEVSNLITSQHSEVQNIPELMADRVLMPIAAYNYLNTTPFNSAMGDGKTLLSQLRFNFPDVEFYATARCNQVAGQSVTIAFCSKPDAMVLRIPGPLRFAPLTQRGFTFETESAFRFGGIDILENAGGRIIQGW